MLKRAPSLTEQVKSNIKERIINDEFGDGRIPSETELADELGVSRTTVRDALSRLEMEGTVVRKQGAGTFVNEPVLQVRTRLEEIWSYEAMLEAHGFTPATRVLEAVELAAGSPQVGPAVAADLKLGSETQILMVSKLFLEDDVPVILTRNFLPLSSWERPYNEEDLRRPVYELIEQVGDGRLAYYLSEIVPVSAAGEIAKVLEINPGTSLISFDETGYNDDNEPIVKSYSYFRDDLLRLRMLRRRI